MKPLTPERRAEIDKKFGFWDCACTDEKDAAPCLRCQFKELADAEQFWREAVKAAQPYPVINCAFCGYNPLASPRKTPHFPNCRWLLAQDVAE